MSTQEAGSRTEEEPQDPLLQCMRELLEKFARLSDEEVLLVVREVRKAIAVSNIPPGHLTAAMTEIMTEGIKSKKTGRYVDGSLDVIAILRLALDTILKS